MAGFHAVQLTDKTGALSVDFDVPASTPDDLLMIMLVSHSLGLNTPSGWTALVQGANIPQGSFNNNKYSTFWKISASEPSVYSVSAPAPGSVGGGFIATYDVGDTSLTPAFSSPPDEGRVSDGTGASATISSATDPNDFDEVLIYPMVGQGVNSATGNSVDGSTTERLDAAYSNGPSNQIFFGLADELFTAAANYPARTFGPATWSGTTEEGISVTRISNAAQASLGNDAWAWHDGQDAWAAA
jgi:hypothetical protein